MPPLSPKVSRTPTSQPRARAACALALASVAALMAGCDTTNDAPGAPRPCTLITTSEVEAATMTTLKPLEEDQNDCKTLSADGGPAIDLVLVTLTVHSFETRRGSTAFYEAVAAQFSGASIATGAEKATCAVSEPFAGGRSVDAFGLVGNLVLQVNVNHPRGVCDMATAIMAAAVGRL